MLKKLLIVMVLLITLPLIANATIINLTVIPNPPGVISGTANGAIFESRFDMNVGTGLIAPFLRIQANGTEKGYNTDGALEFDTKSGPWTHSLPLSDLAGTLMNIGGTDYYQFLLDVNETKVHPLITLTALQIYLGSVGTLTGYPALGTKIFDLDVGPDGNSEVRLDYSNNEGSGNGLDMFAYIPVSLFGNDSTKYVYLYSEFGQPDGTDDGFEEWAITKNEVTPPIPEPGTLLLLGSGLVGLFGYGRLRLQRRNKVL